MPPSYIGRFAPSPSGPLHFGSIVAALGSFLHARQQNGRWLIRIEDIDIPRNQPGASEAILKGLETLGLHWDGEIIYQNQRIEAYEEALAQLQQNDLVFQCSCPRKLTRGKPYPGTCRNREPPSNEQYSIRLKTENKSITVEDAIQNALSQLINKEVGDFIVKRSDRLFAYHLAVVVDDAWQNITHIVRGVDLWDSTPRQVYLQKLLGLDTPHYCHLPIAVNEEGRKISKTNYAQDALLNKSPAKVLVDTLRFLGQEPDLSLVETPVEDVIQWGIKNWQIDKVPRCMEILHKEK